MYGACAARLFPRGRRHGCCDLFHEPIFFGFAFLFLVRIWREIQPAYRNNQVGHRVGSHMSLALLSLQSFLLGDCAIRRELWFLLVSPLGGVFLA